MKSKQYHGLTTMIFNRFFSPQYESKNPKVRLESIANLSPVKQKEKSILHELAFNDDNAEVILAALEKLNSFPLWQKMSQIATNQRVKKQAKKWVENKVITRDPILSNNEFIDFVLNSASADLAKQVLVDTEYLKNEPQVVVQLIDKLEQESVFTFVCLNYENDKLLSTLINSTVNFRLLEKLLKKSSSQVLSELVKNRLITIEQEKLKPIQLEKKVTLVLAKLKALLDKSDFPFVDKRCHELFNEFKECSKEFNLLDKNLTNELTAKFELLKGKITTHLEKLKPEWLAAQSIREHERLRDLAKGQLMLLEREVESLFSNKFFEATLADVQRISEHAQLADEQIENLRAQSVVQANDEILFTQLSVLKRKIDNFPSSQQQAKKMVAVVEAAELLLSNVIDDEIHQYDVEWKNIQHKWHDISEAVSVFPEVLLERWNLVNKKWNKAQHLHLAKSKKKISQCRKQLAQVDALLSRGKYKYAITKFSAVSQAYSELDQTDSIQLKRQYEIVEQEVKRLASWQADLAAPRKPFILEEAKELSTSSMLDVSERLKQIKYLRKQWQTFGAIESEEDRQLNRQFDEVMATAYAPCQAHFDNIAAQKEKAKINFEQLVEDVRNIDDSLHPSQLFRIVDGYKKQWRKVDSIEQEEYKKLKYAFDKSIQPINKMVEQWQAENEIAKTKLISDVENLSSGAISKDTIEQVKLLQAKWKSIGHAGYKHDNRLWKLFRKKNDVFFELAKSQKDATKATELKRVNGYSERLRTLYESIEQSSIAELKTCSVKLNELEQEWQSAEIKYVKKEANELDRKLVDCKELISKTIKELKDKGQQQEIDALISLFKQWNADTELVALQKEHCWNLLNTSWKTALIKSESDSELRKQSTVDLEILLDLGSPADDIELKNKRKLILLSDKLGKGETLSTDSLVLQWIKCGKVTLESNLLTRFERILQAISGV